MKVFNLEVPDIYPFESHDLIEIIKRRIPYVIEKSEELGPGFHKFSMI